VELSEGSNTSLIAMVSPPNASNTAVVWTSADKSIAVVDSQGKISALKEGETYIKVTTEDGNYSDSCLLVVNTIAVPVEEVQVSDKIMYVRVNEAATITATVLPEFASNKSVVWSSSDETIASITDDGEITAYKEGEVLLIVIAQDGGHADSCTLIVNNEFIMHNAFVYIPVVNPATGKTWLDRNLGASQVATSSTDERAYGDLYQWGRQADGHEKRNSNIAAVLSDSDTPDHDKFIIVNATPNDWRTPQNNALWQGPEHKNNPCPAGYKVPTQVEWQEELDSWAAKMIWVLLARSLNYQWQVIVLILLER
ncbi:MAG: Ig domain-containing protein, partial [Fibrobacter sp.]|nr:Ig domain-containing protein [Fibrobacter sp.]